MQEPPSPGLTPFVFLDPGGKRWPRLRLVLVLSALLFFIGTILFVQTLFVAPQLRVPFSLRQLKGQLKSLQKENPAPRHGHDANRRRTRCGWRFIRMAILTAMHHSSDTRRKLRTSARNGWRW